MPETKDLLHHLLNYVTEVERLRMQAPRQVPDQHFRRHQHELKGLPGVGFNLSRDGDDVWLRIERLVEMPPPALPTDLVPWVSLSKSPGRRPELRTSISVASDAGEPRTLLLEQAPEIRAAYDDYVANDWTPWAAEETRRRVCIDVYRKLFFVHQTISQDSAERPLELVMGMAMAAWRPADGSPPILHPLLTQSCEIQLHPTTFALEVRPSGQRPSLEIAVYSELQIPGVAVVEAAWRTLQEAQGDALNPFETPSFAEIARSAVSYLDPDGRFESRAEDPSLPVPGEQLVVTDTWVLFARNRSADIILNDLAAFHRTIDAANNIPQLIERFVQEINVPVDFAPTRNYRGLVSTHPGEDAEELFFPLPYNDEQLEILERLEHSDGVVVQGPPGTGKSHGIANLISHFLATGRTVLVTAKSETALAVIQDKLPREIRPLTVALLTGDVAGQRQFEHNVRTIDARLASTSPARANARIGELQAQIGRTHARLARIDEELARRAGEHLTPRVVLGESLVPVEIARRLVDMADSIAWFDDRPDGPDLEPALDPEDLRALADARQRLGEDLALYDTRIPAIDALPTNDALRELHRDLKHAAELATALQRGDLMPLAATATADAIAQLVLTLDRRSAALAPSAGAPWTIRLLEQFTRLGPGDPVVASLRELIGRVNELEHRRRGHVAQALELPAGAERDPVLRSAMERAAAGQRAFLLPIGNGAQRALMAAMRRQGQPIAEPAGWRDALDVLLWRDEVERALASWSAFAAELGLPALPEGTGPERFRALPAWASQVDALAKVAFEIDPALRKGTTEVFGAATALSTPPADAELARLGQAARAHLARRRLATAHERRAALAQTLAACRGPLVDGLRAFVSEQLGAEALSEDALVALWAPLQRELARQAALQPDLREVRRITERIEAAGAPKWAHRLRTRPRAPASEVDAELPARWREAWVWRRLSMLLEGIDAHDVLRRLFEERRRLTQSLAADYQSVIAERTWLSVAQRADTGVRAALRAYLAAVMAMGQGTGRGAVLHRRDARQAMRRAHLAVPCWILPHWRVSEALPPEFGLFDLVVIDEASQSDAASIPALLRGRKLLVVGDDKQVSPSAVGVTIEQQADLRGRFLDPLPPSVGPMLLPGKSLYDLAGVLFAGHNVMLREHFRSVAPIIEFSNREYYQQEIIPLRVPTASERIDPPLVDVHVIDGRRRGDVNELEACAVVDEIAAICADPALAGRTLGVVTLVGTAQAHRIHELIAQRIDPREVLRREIAVGPPPVFQGRERDIMLISMVLDPSSRGAADARQAHQRYNVALTRARDRMYLFRSLTEQDVNPGSITAKVITYFRNPTRIANDHGEDLRALCASPFEEEVYDHLTARGYRCTPQVVAGPYRIDLVVDDDAGRRLAIECDGDRWHGPGQWPADMARQRTLERAGWVFWRCFASTWVRRREDAIADLDATLARLNIAPAMRVAAPALSLSRVYRAPEVDPEGEDAAHAPALPLPPAPAPAPAPTLDAGSTRNTHAELPALPARPAADVRAGGAQAALWGAPQQRPEPTFVGHVREAIRALLPENYTWVTNAQLREQISHRLSVMVDDDTYRAARAPLVQNGEIEIGRGRGGTLRRAPPPGSFPDDDPNEPHTLQ